MLKTYVLYVKYVPVALFFFVFFYCVNFFSCIAFYRS